MWYVSDKGRTDSDTRKRSQSMSAIDTTSPLFNPITKLGSKPSRRSTVEYADWTSVVLKNVPLSLNTNMLLMVLDQGFQGRYDAVYLPVNFKAQIIFGYARVNFVSHEDAVRFKTEFDGFRDWDLGDEAGSPKILWGDIHGKEEWIREYKNSDIMHPHVPEDMKPLLFEDGAQVAFPPNTKKLKMPKAFKLRKIEKL